MMNYKFKICYLNLTDLLLEVFFFSFQLEFLFKNEAKAQNLKN